jgi:hypothetical protein
MRSLILKQRRSTPPRGLRKITCHLRKSKDHFRQILLLILKINGGRSEKRVSVRVDVVLERGGMQSLKGSMEFGIRCFGCSKTMFGSVAITELVPSSVGRPLVKFVTGGFCTDAWVNWKKF